MQDFLLAALYVGFGLRDEDDEPVAESEAELLGPSDSSCKDKTSPNKYLPISAKRLPRKDNTHQSAEA